MSERSRRRRGRQPHAGPARALRRAARPGPRRAGIGRRRRDARPRRAQRGAARALRRRCGWSGWTATRGAGARDRAAGAVRRRGPRLVHAVYDELPEVLADLGLDRVAGRAVRPRGLVAAAGRGATAASPTPRTRRWTCGWTRPAASPPPRSSTPTPRRTWPGCCGCTARSASPPGSPTRSCASAEREPFTGTARLAELVRDSIPAATRRTGGHPAKRTFQALRIEVNGELAALERALPAARRRARRRRPDRRAVLPLAGGPARQAGARRRRDEHRAARTCRSSCPSTSRRCGCSPAAPRRRATTEVAANPRRGLGAAARRRAAPGRGMSLRHAARRRGPRPPARPTARPGPRRQPRLRSSRRCARRRPRRRSCCSSARC